MMRKCFAILMLCFLMFGQAYAVGLGKYQRTFASDRAMTTNGLILSSGALNRLITSFGTNPGWIVLDSGQWDITNNVAFPTNIVLELTQRASFNIFTNNVLTINGPFLAPYGQIAFTGSGTATGAAVFLYRDAGWGDTTQYDIGDGLLDSYVDSIVTNLYESNGGIILTTTNLSENGGFVVTTSSLPRNITNAFPNLSQYKARGYIKGMWPVYVDSDTVTITNGEGYCSGSYFIMTNSISYDLTGLTATEEVNNLYLDFSVSTFPSTLSIYDSTSAAVYVYSENGYYCSTSTSDRLLASLYSTGTILEVFGHDDGANIITDQITLEDTLTGSPLWTNSTTAEASTKLPATASHVYLRLYGYDVGGATLEVAASRKELRDDYGVSLATNLVPFDIFHQGSTKIGVTQWMPLGPSRDIYIYGDSVDDDWEVKIMGWRINR